MSDWPFPPILTPQDGMETMLARADAMQGEDRLVAKALVRSASLAGVTTA